MLKVLAFDDEQPALLILEYLLGEIKEVIIDGLYSDYDLFIRDIQLKKPDIVFLDIENNQKSGIKIANEIIDIDTSIDIVFVTAYREYAAEAFDLEALDYILKPINKERLSKAIRRIYDKRKNVIHTTNNLQIKCMKRFEIICHGTGVHCRTKKTKELFALLVHNCNSELSSDKIIDLLWPDIDYPQAKNLLYTTIYNLKKIFADIAAQDLKIIKNSLGFKLEAPSSSMDFYQLEGCLNRVINEPKIQENHFYDIHTVLELYSGGYFEEDGFLWAEQKKILLHNKFILFAMRLFDYYNSNQKYDLAADVLNRIIVNDIYNEDAYKKIIVTYNRMNNITLMKKTYDDYRAIMINDLGMTPKSLHDIINDKILY